jgi:N-acetyltransferase
MINFDCDYILEDTRVLLTPLGLDDYNHLLPFVNLEPNLWQYSLIKPNSPQKMLQYIESTLLAKATKTEYAFLVFDKQINAYAGSTRFYDIQTNNNSTQLGYTWYGKDFCGTGLNKHCKYLLLNFAFETLGFDRVEFRADANNSKSIAAMKSIGCTTEGILRSNTIKDDGSRRDSIVLSILKTEWETQLKERLRTKLG